MGDVAVGQANATLDIVHEIATILDTGLSKEEVAIIIALIENGVNPQVSFSTCEGPMCTGATQKVSECNACNS